MSTKFLVHVLKCICGWKTKVMLFKNYDKLHLDIKLLFASMTLSKQKQD